MKRMSLISMLFLLSCGGPRGYDGPQGDAGLPGIPGLDGQNCEVTQLENGVLIECPSSSAVVLNGQDGEAGEDGLDALAGMFGISEILNPCGPGPANEQVLLKLSNGLVLALFDGGPHLDRLVLLTPYEVYETSDANHGCEFSVDNEGNLL